MSVRGWKVVGRAPMISRDQDSHMRVAGLLTGLPTSALMLLDRVKNLGSSRASVVSLNSAPVIEREIRVS